MKKIFKFSLLMSLVVLFCCGCEGDVTRALRHAGFTISGEEFVCNTFYNDEGLSEEIRYLTENRIITNYGRIYELSLGKTFSNSQNCKAADTELKVKSILDSNIFRADDGRIYRLVGDGQNGNAYSQVPSTDNNYFTYSLLLQGVDVIKVVTVDSSNLIYYVLKSDGNVYGYTLTKGDRNTPPTVAGTTIVYNQSDYGGPIIDFGYFGDSTSTFVRTEDRVFHLVMDNAEECTKYADIKCTYHMEEDPVFNEQAEYILAFNGSTLITTYNKVFTRGN